MRIMIALLCILSGLTTVRAANDLGTAIKEGKLLLNIRFRVEAVDQDGAAKDALATTLRTRLGYQTGDYNGWNILLEAEDVSVVGDTRYNDTTGEAGLSRYPVVADPADTEVNRAQLTYSGLEDNALILGRQRIILDNARFVGNVGWRQNEQTYDGLIWQNKALTNTTFTTAYLANANRIFGEHHPNPAFSDIRLSAFILHGKVAKLPVGDLAAFVHLFDYEDAPIASHKNLGLRLNGKIKVNDTFGFTHDLSYVNQSSYADGLDTNDADYYSIGVGPRWEQWGIKLNYEVLGGDGVYGFATPFATLHAFNGWADKFLGTPATGLTDLFLSFDYAANGWKFVGVYHQFEADEGDGDYGDELDLLVAKKINKHLSVGLKGADYSADDHSTDTTKIWAWLQWSW